MPSLNAPYGARCFLTLRKTYADLGNFVGLNDLMALGAF